MRRLLDAIMRTLARVLVHIFFRRVEVEAGGRLPREGPVVVVANRTNGLVNGLLLMSSLGRFPRFLGKSTLFRIPPLWPFLKLAGVIPVYRAADGSTERNRSAFAESNRLLANGGVVAIFPEGISHDESSVQPLRTGAARIALEADKNDRGAELAIVAVGLIYDDKPRFRSRAPVRVGGPVPMSAWSARAVEDLTGTVRQLTDAVAAELDAVSPPYATWTQADELAQIADVVARRPGDETVAEVDLARRTDIAERLATLDEQPACAGALDELRVAHADYQRDLNLIGLADAEVASHLSRGALRWLVAWSVLKVVLGLPLAMFGVVVHVIPFQIVKRLARIPANEGMRATVKLLGCFFLFVLTYAVIGVTVGLLFGAWSGAVIAVLAPLGGFIALRLFERIRRVGGILAGRRTWRYRHELLDSVIEHRSEVVSTARSVLASQ